MKRRLINKTVQLFYHPRKAPHLNLPDDSTESKVIGDQLPPILLLLLPTHKLAEFGGRLEGIAGHIVCGKVFEVFLSSADGHRGKLLRVVSSVLSVYH